MKLIILMLTLIMVMGCGKNVEISSINRGGVITKIKGITRYNEDNTSVTKSRYTVQFTSNWRSFHDEVTFVDDIGKYDINDTVWFSPFKKEVIYE
jgi:hypothetical protein